MAAGPALGLLACRPVIAIGWGELLILFLVIAFLLGPLLLKLARSWKAYHELSKTKRD